MAPEIDPAGAVGPTSLPDPVAGVTAALVGLAAVNGYLTGSGEDDLADADMLATVLVGLGHLDAAITAARARTIVAVEDASSAGCRCQAVVTPRRG